MKPENFVIGRKNKERTIYLIDFGLSRKYINENNIHISMKKDRNIIGTVRYISMNTHQGIEQSRRDDLESLIYIIIYFIKGELPWQNIKAKNKTERYNKIYEMKKKSTEKGGELCSSLPNGFQTIIDYVLELEFTEKPDYSMLKKVVEIILAHNNYFNDLQFDWYNLDFLKNLYKSPLVTDNNNNNKSSNNDIKENENKGIVKENNKEINNYNDKINKNKKEIKNNINGKKSDINNANKNNVHHNYFKRNQSISKTKNSTTISESKNNKYKSPAPIKNSTLHKNSIQDNTEIKTVKTFLQGNNRTKQWNDILNIKDNSSIKFMKSKNNISHIYKK
jgi:casein kinase I family protein HRR25